MRIAVFAYEFPAVSETFVLNQVTGLLDAGHDVSVFAQGPRSDGLVHDDFHRFGLQSRTHYPTIPDRLARRAAKGPALMATMLAQHPGRLLNCLNMWRYGRFSLSGRLLFWAHLLRDEAPFDAILAHFGPVGELAVQLRDAGAIDGPIATVMHGVDVSVHSNTDSTAYDRLFQAGDLFLPISDHWRNKLGRLGCPADKTQVHHMGVDTQRYRFKSRSPANGNPLQLLTVGRLVEKKGIADALTAVAMAVGRGLDIEFTIIGGGPLHDELVQLRDRLGLESSVYFAGWRSQEEIVCAMEEADILLAPSVTTDMGDQEGIPVTIMEAMASGMIVLSTWHSGIPELVEDGVTGLLIDEGDTVALANALVRLSAESGDEWAQFSIKAREKVVREFDIANLNGTLEAILKNMAGAWCRPTRRDRSAAA
jgi:colanic acid/amylovoran biosynthesis glycosyltransferase